MDSNIDYVDLLSKGENVWNKWRINNPDKTPCLRDINFLVSFPAVPSMICLNSMVWILVMSILIVHPFVIQFFAIVFLMEPKSHFQI